VKVYWINGICILHLMGDDLKLPLAYCILMCGNNSVWKKINLESVWVTFKDIWPRYFRPRAISCKKLPCTSKFLVARSKLNIGRCILSHSEGCDFEKFSGGSSTCNTGIFTIASYAIASFWFFLLFIHNHLSHVSHGNPWRLVAKFLLCPLWFTSHISHPGKA